MRTIIHSEEECIFDISRNVQAAKEAGTEGADSESYFEQRLSAAIEAEAWVNAVKALVFWSDVEALGVCNCKSAWGADRPGRVLPVSLKVRLD